MDGVNFEVHDFVEGHNHDMVAECDMKFVRSVGKLTQVQEETIYELSNLNLGPVKVFNVMRTQDGGFEKVGATKDDYKNFKQDLNCFIGEYVAEMIVQRLCAKNKFSADYSFEYDVNDNGGIIHCAVGAGLLASENIESCTWLLKMLLESFGSAPNVIIIFRPDYEASYCICISKCKAYVIWDPNYAIIKILSVRYVILCRQIQLVLLYLRDKHLSGLMRTTSRSESENHFFGQATNSQLTLVVFFNHLDFSMDIQRDNSRRCDHDSRYTYPELVTKSYLEGEAVRIYTRSIFNDVQAEIIETVGGVSLFKASEEEEGGYLRCKICDFKAYVPEFLEFLFKKDGEFGEEYTATYT
ncbi:protein FAR1-RELATED SEQUENCE 5-like [Bidens hawaiensis]|uniref:protein FAR1-RELATED SEQUENCE 5-like n=1 Tax=Bidens hawaiensis TaxID=980011 RepID=UPI004049065F